MLSSDEMSSDEELQEEFSKGNLQPGLIVRKAPLRTYTNNVAGMQEKLAVLKEKTLQWIERMDITAPASESTLSEAEEGEGEGEDAVDPEDDFKREMHFYHQAQASVLIGLRKLEGLGVPTARPEDYYAEMVKTDDHMRKVRQSLLSKQKLLEHREKARKLRELKKYGKKVQHDILEKRRAEKKATLEAVKKYKKGRGERPSFLDSAGDGSFPVAAIQGGGSGAGGGAKKKPVEKSKKRMLKDQKFGFGGKKRRSKSNTAESSADTSFFKHSRKTGVGGKGKGKGGRGQTQGKRSKQDRRGAVRGGRKKGKTVRTKAIN